MAPGHARMSWCGIVHTGAATAVAITLPLPPPAGHQNERVHWAVRRRQFESAKDQAFLAMRAVMAVAGLAGEGRQNAVRARGSRAVLVPAVPARPAWAVARYQVVFTFPDRRRRDQANYLAACKPYTDGVAAAGLISDDDDDHLRLVADREPVVFSYRSGGPGSVEMRFFRDGAAVYQPVLGEPAPTGA